MKIGIVSDTHRNRELLDNVVEWLVTRQHIIYLYHLGDDYEDVNGLEDYNIEIVQVPGIYHSNYFNGTLAKKMVENILGLRVMLVHSYDKDVTEEDKTVTDVILYGHTHKAEIKLDDGLLLMNPGHLKSSMDKQNKATFGLMEIQDNNVSVQILNTDFKVEKSMNLIRSESGLYRS